MTTASEQSLAVAQKAGGGRNWWDGVLPRPDTPGRMTGNL